MPKECLDCRFVSTNDDACQCERCGGPRLRFSVLAGMKFRERAVEAAHANIGEDERPTHLDRVRQAGMYLLASQAAAFILLGAAVFATPDDEVPKKQSLAALLEAVGEVYPAWSLLGLILIPAAAAAAAVVFTLRGVYLAQQIGLVLGPAAAAGALAAISAAGGAVPLLAWLLSPPLAAGLAFVAGLRMTGYLRSPAASDSRAVEYKPVDSWDRDAQPRFLDLRVARQGYHRKLGKGLAAGGVATYLLPFLLGAMSGTDPEGLTTAKMIFGWGGVAIAGAFAAAGTNSPVLQGALAGIAMFFVRHYSHDLVVDPETLVQIWLHGMAGICGGAAGRLFFPPPRVVRGRERRATDGIVYVGDELVKNSA